jgi:hypothetical protein
MPFAKNHTITPRYEIKINFPEGTGVFLYETKSMWNA